jgi:hypothetical protein
MPLLEHYGWPTDVIGVGSFAIVFEDPKNRARRVLKFTNDEVDGTASSYIQMAQEGRVSITHNAKGLVKDSLPLVYSVGLVEFKSKNTDRKDGIWCINIERVVPLNHDARPVSSSVKTIVNEAFEDWLRPEQREVLAFMASRQRQRRSYADLPQSLRRNMMKSLGRFQQRLSDKSAEVGGRGYDVLANILGDASVSVETLLELGVPVADLHSGNFGFKLDKDTGEPTTNLVVTDFGLSSLDDQQRKEAYAGATELRAKPKAPPVPKKFREHPGQMKLFNNPKPPRLGTVMPGGALIQVIGDDMRWKTLATVVDAPNPVSAAVAKLVRKGIDPGTLWIRHCWGEREMWLDVRKR